MIEKKEKGMVVVNLLLVILIVLCVAIIGLVLIGDNAWNIIDPENVDDLCKKTINYGLTWAKRAEPLWKENLENKQKAKEEKNKKENNDCLIKN